MVRKAQLPVIGGIRKVITIPGSNTAVGTTIAELGSSTVTLAQLAAIISNIQAQQQNTGGGNIGDGTEAVLVVGPGLSGGGPMLGTVGIRLSAPIPWGLDDGGGGGDGDPGPPGVRGLSGANGAPGSTGPQGPIGLTGTTLVYANTTVPAGNTVANTSAETFFTSSYTVLANSLALGTVLRIKLFGVYSTGVVAPSLILRVYFGATVLIASGTLTTVANITNDGWSAEGLFTVQTIGVSGTIEAQGLSEFSTASTVVLFVNMDNAAPITVDTTTNEVLRASVQWGGTVTASDTITLREMTVEVMAVTGIPPAPAPTPFYVFFGDDGADGDIGPPGAAGASGANGGSSNPFNLAPESHTGTPTFVQNDEFEQAAATAIDTAGTRFSGATAWTWGNQGTSTALQSGDGNIILLAQNDGTLHGVYQPASGTFKRRARFYLKNSVISPADHAAIFAYNSGTGHIVAFGPFETNTPSYTLAILKWTNFTTFSALGFNALPYWLSSVKIFEPMWYELRSDGTTLTFAVSTSGVDGSFIDVVTETIATFLTTVDSAGLCLDSNSTPASALVADLWRKY